MKPVSKEIARDYKLGKQTNLQVFSYLVEITPDCLIKSSTIK